MPIVSAAVIWTWSTNCRFQIGSNSVLAKREIRIFCTVRTFFIVCIGYVLFRAASAADALTVYRTVFTGFRINAPEIAAALVPFGNGNQAAASVLIIGVFIIGLFAYELSEIKGSDVISRHKYILSGVMIVSIILFGVFGQSNFLYQAF